MNFDSVIEHLEKMRCYFSVESRGGLPFDINSAWSQVINNDRQKIYAKDINESECFGYIIVESREFSISRINVVCCLAPDFFIEFRRHAELFISKKRNFNLHIEITPFMLIREGYIPKYDDIFPEKWIPDPEGFLKRNEILPIREFKYRLESKETNLLETKLNELIQHYKDEISDFKHEEKNVNRILEYYKKNIRQETIVYQFFLVLCVLISLSLTAYVIYKF